MRPQKHTGQSFGALVCLIGLFLSCVAGAAEKNPERALKKITIAYSSLSGNMAPLWITHERGIFRKHGLDVQLVFIESGSTTAQSLAAGDVTFAQMAGAAVIQSRLRGSDLVMIAGAVNTLTFKFYVGAAIQRPEQLKGNAVAVTRIGSSTDFAVRYALEKYGLAAGREVAVIEAGSMPAIFAALQSGWVQGAMLSAPFTGKARTVGLPLLADLQMLGLEYQHTGLATTRALIDSQPDLVRTVLRAYVEGIHYYKTQRAESLAVLAKYLKGVETEVLSEMYEDIGIRLTAEKPYPTLRGIQIMLRELAARDPRARKARPEDFADLSFIRELDGSGFIDRLYKSRPAAGVAETVVTPATSSKGLSRTDSATARTADESPFQEAREYTIQAGDTLSALALRYYGSPYRWDKIYEANKASMTDPNHIYVGQRIMIPA